MNFDLSKVPFSRRGSYFAVSRLENSRVGVPDGLYLRTVHGCAKNKELLSLQLTKDGNLIPFTEAASPQELIMKADAGYVTLCIPQADRIFIRGTGVGLALIGNTTDEFDLIVQQEPNQWEHICFGANLNLMISKLAGNCHVEALWNGSKDEKIVFTIVPNDKDQFFEITIEEFKSSFLGLKHPENFDACVSAIAEDYSRWLNRIPNVPHEFARSAELAAYVNWSSSVNENGLINRPSMLMSKNWMTNIWSWDHCFNAMALTRDIEQACNQFLTVFDHQDEYGALPDFFNDSQISYNFCKPPIHGWVLQWLMKRVELPAAFLRRIYRPLCRWTLWWFTYRDFDGDGFPQYNHGNDSGWDNSTVFREFVPVESPDLIAFLILQAEVLARLAEKMGRFGEQKIWKEKSENLLAGLIKNFWTGSHFAARRAMTHDRIESDSLLMYIPLVLGHRLPKYIFNTMVDVLIRKGFLTRYGLATERPDSPFYKADGYWRGPIWAPSTLLIVDGLADGGRTELSSRIAHNFCDMAAKNGMSENFDALTGHGLRDNAYTWTSSVFLILASQYL